MQNSLSRFLNNRFIQPAVDAGVAKALSDQHPPVYGASTVPEHRLGQSISQPHDFGYTLLNSAYRLNVDVAFGNSTPLHRSRERGVLLWVAGTLAAACHLVDLFVTTEHAGVSNDIQQPE